MCCNPFVLRAWSQENDGDGGGEDRVTVVVVLVGNLDLGLRRRGVRRICFLQSVYLICLFFGGIQAGIRWRSLYVGYQLQMAPGSCC